MTSANGPARLDLAFAGTTDFEICNDGMTDPRCRELS
jgi:hypothetical protein